MQYEDIINKLKSLSDPKAVEGMARFGINPENTYGVSIPNLRKLAREAGEEVSKLVVRWAITDRPAATEEELHKKYRSKFGKLPQYTEHT